MKGRILVSKASFWLVLPLILLGCIGFFYLHSQGFQQSLSVTEIDLLPSTTDSLVFALKGEELSRNKAGYLALDSSNQRAIVGSIPVWGRAEDIEIINDKAYVLVPDNGLKIYGLDNPLTPEYIDGKPSREGARQIDVDQEILYLSSLTQGTSIFDMSSPFRHLSTIPTSGLAYSSIHRDQRLFVAEGKAGLSVYDISDLSHSKPLGQLSLPGNTVKLAFFGRYLLAASMRGGLHLIEISDLLHPHLLQSIDGQAVYENIAIVDKIVYASDTDHKIDLFTLEGGQLKKQVSFPLLGHVRDFLRHEQSLYLAEGAFGVTKLDIRDPLNPQRVGFVGMAGEANGLAFYKDYLFVASRSQGVQIIDVNRIESRKVIASVDTPSDARDFEIDENWIYVADGRSGLQIVDIRNKNQWKIVANLPSQYFITTLLKFGDLVFLVVQDQGLLVVDVSNPLIPRQVGLLELDAEISDLAVRGTNLFAGCFDHKLLRIDISEPEHPRLAETLPLTGRARRISLQGDKVFIAAGKAGLLIVQFADGQPGRLIGQLNSPWPMAEFGFASGVEVRREYAYLIQGEEGLQVVDIRKPEEPRVVSSVYHSGWILGIKLSANYAVLSTRAQGYLFIDISDPLNPFQAARIYSPRSTGQFEIIGDELYSSGRSIGISLLPLPEKNISGPGLSDRVLMFNKPKIAGWYDLNITDGQTLEKTTSAVRID